MAPPPLAELTARAQTLSSAGDLAGARRVLANVLDPAFAADPRAADPDLAFAAALHARILIALGDPHAARLWAGFAQAAEERLHGPRHDRTLAAAAIHAAVLQRVGHYGHAAQIYEQLVGNLAALDGADTPRVLAAEADLATTEHAAGHCTSARHRLTDAWVRHRHHHGDAAPAGIKMLARLGAMERECARDAEAVEHLALAQELCARYLPADHPLVRQVAGLATQPATGRHICGRVAQSAGPPPPAEAGPRRNARPPAPPEPDRYAEPEPDQYAGPEPDQYAGPEPDRYAEPEPDQYAGPEPDRYAEPEPGPYQTEGPAQRAVPFPRRPTVPDPADGDFPPDLGEQPPPDFRPTDPNGTVYQQPLYLADVHNAPGDPTGRHARADTPPPLPGHRAAEFYGPDGRPQPIGTAPTGTLATPPNSERLLPVRTAPPAAPRRQPFLLVGVLIAGIAAAAVVVALTLPDANGAVRPDPTAAAPTSAAGTTPSTATPAGDPGAPTGVRLRDNRDSVALTWRYPADAEGPVLVSGGRQGQPLKVFQQLAAGTGDYMVYGLNENLNYCFTVAVAYSTDRIAASGQVCTRR